MNKIYVYLCYETYDSDIGHRLTEHLNSLGDYTVLRFPMEGAVNVCVETGAPNIWRDNISFDIIYDLTYSDSVNLVEDFGYIDAYHITEGQACRKLVSLINIVASKKGKTKKNVGVKIKTKKRSFKWIWYVLLVIAFAIWQYFKIK